MTLPSKPGEYIWAREGEILRCPWHGWEFDITTGRSIFNPHRMRVRTYEVTVEPDEDPDCRDLPGHSRRRPDRPARLSGDLRSRDRKHRLGLAASMKPDQCHMQEPSRQTMLRKSTHDSAWPTTFRRTRCPVPNRGTVIARIFQELEHGPGRAAVGAQIPALRAGMNEKEAAFRSLRNAHGQSVEALRVARESLAALLIDTAAARAQGATVERATAMVTQVEHRPARPARRFWCAEVVSPPPRISDRAHRHPGLGELPGRFQSSEAAADDMDLGVHRPVR